MDAIDELLTKGVEKIYPSKDALEKVLRSGKKLRLYQGFDPSMPNLHLGNLVGILKLKGFQDLGHEVIFLVGDFTGMIGDPTDRASTRKKLTREQVLSNCQNWKEQAGKVLTFSGKNPAKFMFNSSWNSVLKFEDVLNLFSYVTVPQLIERDMFQKRIKKGEEIFFHELCYPIIQGYDSVAMDVDLEIGGSDQTFNMLIGRTLMKKIKNKEKFVLTTKLLVDNKGEKVGKTAGNALFLNAPPSQMYGGTMSFPDDVIILGFELLTEVPFEKIDEFQKQLSQNKANPMDLKKKLALEIVRMYYGEEQAKEAQEEFERVFQKGKTPVSNILTYYTQTGRKNIVDLLVETKLAPSRSEAKRLVEQKAVKMNGVEVSSIMNNVSIKDGMIIKVGKRRFVKIKTS